MMDARLKALAQVTEAAFQADQARLSRLTQQETAVIAELEELDRRSQASFLRGLTEAPPLSLGADQLWRGWLARQRRDALIRLAAIRARRAEAVQRLSRSFGRSSAAEEMAAMAVRQDRAVAAGADLARLQSLMILARPR